MSSQSEAFKEYVERLKKAGKYSGEDKAKVDRYAEEKGFNSSGSNNKPENNSKPEPTRSEPDNKKPPTRTSSTSSPGRTSSSPGGNVSRGQETVRETTSKPSQTVESFKNKTNQPTTPTSQPADGGYDKKDTTGMSEQEKEIIRKAGIRWKQADAGLKNGSLTPEEAERIKTEEHKKAEEIRSKYGFSGGTDGTGTAGGNETAGTVETPSTSDTTQPGTTPVNGSKYDHPEDLSTEVKAEIDALGKKWMEIDAKQKAGEMSEDEAMKQKDELHSRAEALRNEAGYTGGTSGNEYEKTNTTETPAETPAENPNAEYTPNEWVEMSEGGQAMFDESGKLIGYRNPDMSPETEALINNINKQLDEAKSAQEFYENAMREITEAEDEPIETLSYEEALEQAKDQLEPIYEKGMNDFMEQADRNAVRRGVFNQVPNEAYKRYKAGELQNEKSAQISSLAQKLRGQSVSEANQTKQLQMQETRNKLNTLMAGLQASGQSNSQIMNALSIINNLRMQDRQLRNQEENTEWEKGMAEENQDFNQKISMAQLTGSIDGEDTMAKKQFDFNKDVTNQQLSQTWSRISNDSQALSQAQQRLGLSYRQQDLSEKQFKLGVQNEAYQMTKEQLASDNPQFDPTVYNALAEQDRQTNGQTLADPGDPSYSSEATRYLDSIMNQSTEEISREEFESLYEQNINKINGELDTLSDYQN